jgi:hypothetical protein
MVLKVHLPAFVASVTYLELLTSILCGMTHTTIGWVNVKHLSVLRMLETHLIVLAHVDTQECYVGKILQTDGILSVCVLTVHAQRMLVTRTTRNFQSVDVTMV